MAYRSITLSPGESYVIPSGATIIGVTNQGLLTSQNDCANFDNLEEFACYALVVTADQRQDSPVRAPWMEGQGFVWSYKIGGVEYDTDNQTIARIGATGEYQFGDLKTSIENNIQVSGLFLDITTNVADSDPYDGGLGSICFKTLPSIGDNMTVTLKSVLGTVYAPLLELKVQPIDYYGGTAAFSGMCTCDVEPPVN
jgi:hypothetical protein